MAQDKHTTKARLVSQGIPTPGWQRVINGKVKHWDCFPAIIKTMCEHGSECLTRANVVSDARTLDARLTELKDAGVKDLIVSEYVNGQEITVSLWGNPILEALPLVEVDFSRLPANAPRVRTYASKWDESEQDYTNIRLICPASLSSRETTQAIQVGRAAFQACGLRDYGRIDLRLCDGQAYVIDVNANPDLTIGSSFVLAAETAGYDYAAMLARIVEIAQTRMTGAQRLTTERRMRVPSSL